MSTVFTPSRMRITTERYQKMVAAGVLTSQDRVELIEGEILDMAPIGVRHAQGVTRLNRQLVLAVGDDALISPGNPVDLGNFSEPQPDLTVLRCRADQYGESHPTASDVLLLIEVSDSSLAFDRGPKRDLYARYGVAEYWIVDVQGELLITHRAPAHGVYGEVNELRPGQTAISAELPALQIAISDLFA